MPQKSRVIGGRPDVPNDDIMIIYYHGFKLSSVTAGAARGDWGARGPRRTGFPAPTGQSRAAARRGVGGRAAWHRGQGRAGELWMCRVLVP